MRVDGRELLLSNLDLIERIIAFTCRRRQMDPADAEEFAATVKLKLVEGDYAVLRKFEGRSRFSTFMTVVIQRMLLDFRIHHWGKWHPSATATQLGGMAVELEKMLLRDERSVDEAFQILAARDRDLTIEKVRSLAAVLPARPPKRTNVGLDEAAELSSAAEDHLPAERARVSAKVSGVVRKFIDSLPQEERLILQLRFDSEMTIAQIARSLHLDQKKLYRRIEQLLRDLRADLERQGVSAGEVRELIDDRGVVLDFHLGNGKSRPSNPAERDTPDPEEASRS